MENLKLLYEQVERKGYLKSGNVNRGRIEKDKLIDLHEVAENITKLTSINNLGKTNSSFAYSASMSLSADSTSCNSIKCRKKRAYNLGQFALMFSDTVYIRNYLSSLTTDCLEHGNEEQVKESFIHDLEILNFLRPLVEKGIVVPVSPHNMCKNCFSKQVVNQYGREADQRFEKLYSRLLNEFLQNSSVYVHFRAEHYVFEIQAPEYLIEHGVKYCVFPSSEGDGPLAKLPSILKRVNSGERLDLSLYARKKIDLESYFAQEIIADIVFEIMISEDIGASFITDRSIEIRLLNELSGDSDLERKNKMTQKHLTSVVPFIDGASFKDLIKIRHGEAEAFISYRQSLSKAIDEYKQHQKSLTEKEAKELYSEFIRPELAKLDKKVKAAKKHIVKKATRSVVSLGAALSFGIYTGFLPQQLLSAAASIGVVHEFRSLVKSGLEAMDKDAVIRNENLYFLWKVREATK